MTACLPTNTCASLVVRCQVTVLNMFTNSLLLPPPLLPLRSPTPHHARYNGVITPDYAPFDVDVTTLDPGDAALQGVGQKAIIYGDENSVSGNDAGIAFIGSFGQGAPAFVCARKLGPNNPKVSMHKQKALSMICKLKPQYQ